MIDIIQEVWSDISRNKLRTALTGFAVAWGIFILIVLLGAGNGVINAFEKSRSGAALNKVELYGGHTSIPYGGMDKGREIKFTERDLDLTKNSFPKTVDEVSANVDISGVTVSYGTEYISANLSGVMPAEKEISGTEIEKGRYVNELDMKERRKVAVISTKAAAILFKTDDAIGKFVNANGVAYQIVGIYKVRGNVGQHELMVPFSTLQLIYSKGVNFYGFTTTVNNLNTMEENDEFEDNVRKVMATSHHFSPDDTGALHIWNQMKRYLQAQDGMGMLSTALWVIGIFTLISGVVGVSNIMLITVKERTHEFGIRKALGAKPRSILALVMAESVAITTLFGYIGMLAGIGLTELVSSIIDTAQTSGEMSSSVFTDPTVDMSVAIGATVTLIVAGALAGFVPAKRAVSIRPIDALRAD